MQAAEILSEKNETGFPEESFKSVKSRVVAEFEKSYIHGLVVAYHGNISRSAQAAKKNRSAFFQLLRKHRIDVQRFK